jgi:hypothetical protein
MSTPRPFVLFKGISKSCSLHVILALQNFIFNYFMNKKNSEKVETLNVVQQGQTEGNAGSVYINKQWVLFTTSITKSHS